MSNKLKCPFCGEELSPSYGYGIEVYMCPNLTCHEAHGYAEDGVWQALIQSLKDRKELAIKLAQSQQVLEVANEKLRHCVNITMEELDKLKDNLLIAYNALLYFSKDPIANNALKKITVPEQKEQ